MEKKNYKTYMSLRSVWPLGIIYGLLVRFMFENTRLHDYWSVMTIGFMFLVPFVLGWLTVYFGESERTRSGLFRIFMPWVPCLLSMGIAMAIGWEGTICIIIAPADFSGYVEHWRSGCIACQTQSPTQYKRSVSSIRIGNSVCLATIEHRIVLPESARLVETQIAINAAPHTVWQNIERVREIQPNEQRSSLFNRVGFPRPVEAAFVQGGTWRSQACHL